MAKRRKETTEEEESDFKIPEFNEEAFVKRERRNIKVTVISFVFGIIIAFLSLGFWALLSGQDLRWILILMVGILMAPWLRYLLLRLNIDFTGFGKKGWFTTYATYFFTWLIVLIILCNPPFYDDESPTIDAVSLPGVQYMDGNVKIIARVIDNVKIKDVSLTLMYPDGTNVSPDLTFDDTSYIYSYVYENTGNLSGEYTYKITAVDESNHKSEHIGTFEFKDNILSITSSIPSPIRLGDFITIQADEDINENIEDINPDNNFRVYYRLDNGAEINVSRKNKDDKTLYETSPKYVGWQPDSNMTMKLYAEVSYYFINLNQKFNNTIENPTKYNFTVGSDSGVGKDAILIPPNPSYALDDTKNQPANALNYYIPYPVGVRVPGFEAIVFIASLVIVALIFKYKKKDRRNQK